MARGKQSIVYLDTHIVVWLYAGLTEKLTENAKRAINDREVLISQMVRLELQHLFEIGRIKAKPSNMIKSLSKSIDLGISDCPLSEIIDEALKIKWTRDVFDRLLVAEATTKGVGFITADEDIKTNLKQAIW
jgi:PIN domain nuclease of toxin-antitoxin system